MATVLTAIVFVFILCHAPKAALNIYEVGTVRALVKYYDKCADFHSPF